MDEKCKSFIHTVMGSREEAELLSSNVNTPEQQKRFDQEWKRIHAYCKSVSGVDDNGLLKEHRRSKIDDLDKAIKGGLYYYRRVERNKRHVHECVYLVPVCWGVVHGKNHWVDDDNVVYDSPESKNGIGQTHDTDEVILVRNGIKTRMSRQKYDAIKANYDIGVLST